MKYIANPVEVEAHKIVAVWPGKPFTLTLENHDYVEVTPEMMSRMMPTVGDYWVIQSDGYVYLNPKHVFERKYRPNEGMGAAGHK